MSDLTSETTVELDFNDIQSGAIHARPSPYVATYFLLRIDDPQSGRALLRLLSPMVDRGVWHAECGT